MASGAKIGLGTLLKRGNGDGPPETFTTIAEVNNISGPSGSRDTVDVTHMESPNGFREFIAGLADPGEISFTVNLIPSNTTHQNLLTDFNLGTVRNWQMVLPFAGNPTLAFEGIVTGYPWNVPLDDKVSADITIKVTGQVSLS